MADDLTPLLDQLSSLLTRINLHVAAVLPRLRTAEGGSGPSESERVGRYLRLRHLRSEIFPPKLFADPAWDMLLDLYKSELENKPISVSSACLASGVPPTTALRHIRVLQNLGLINRVGDPRDSRRVWLELSATGRAALATWVARAFQDDALPTGDDRRDALDWRESIRGSAS